MGPVEIFLIRLSLSLFFAFLISRFFFEGVVITRFLGLAIVMLGLAYLFEYLRTRGKT